MAIELKQAPPEEVRKYDAWIRDPDKKQALPYAISLYKMGEVEGARTIEGAGNVPFRAVWKVTNLPSEVISCQVTFSGSEPMTYEVDLPNHEFVSFLVDTTKMIHGRGVADFSEAFYSKLFRIKV
jgi:hypothetical protein